jgi:hypothetical protein
VGFVIYKVALEQVFSEYFGFPCQFSFHRLRHTHHPSSEAGTIGQLVADVPSEPSLTPLQATKKETMNSMIETLAGRMIIVTEVCRVFWGGQSFRRLLAFYLKTDRDRFFTDCTNSMFISSYPFSWTPYKIRSHVAPLRNTINVHVFTFLTTSWTERTERMKEPGKTKMIL